MDCLGLIDHEVRVVVLVSFEKVLDARPRNSQGPQGIGSAQEAPLAQPVHGFCADVQQFADLPRRIAERFVIGVWRHFHMSRHFLQCETGHIF